MSAETAMEQKLRAYLESLPVSSRRALLKDLQKAEVTGTISEHNTRILRILEDLVDLTASNSVSEAAVIDALFKIFSDFVFDKQTETKLRPRIMHSSVETVYRWLRRDIFPKEIHEIEEKLKGAIEAENAPLIDVCQKKFVTLVQPFLVNELPLKCNNPEEKRKLVAQLGGEIILEDALDLGYLIKHLAAIVNLQKLLPEEIDGYDEDIKYSLQHALKSFSKALPDETRLFFTLLYHRFQKPENILRFMQDEMQTDDPVRLAESRFGFCLDIVLHDITVTVDQISANVGQVRSGQVSLDEFKTYIQLSKMFKASLDTTSQSAWVKRFGDQVKRISALLTVELSQLPQLLRQALGYVRSDKGASKPDEIAKNQAVYVSKLLMDSKRGSDTLALNALLPKVSREAEQYVDVVSGRVLDEVRSPNTLDRDTSKLRLRYLAEIAAILFDQNYADVLLKSGGLSGGLEPKKATA